MPEQIETPHKIKDFNAIAHDNMIRQMAAKVIQSNKSNLETVKAHVSEVKQKIKAHKIEQNQFKVTLNKAKNLANLASISRAVMNSARSLQSGEC